MTAVSSSFPAILQRLHRINDSRSQQAAPGVTDEASSRAKGLNGLGSEKVRRKRHRDGRIAYGQQKLIVPKPISTFPVSFPSEAASNSVSEQPAAAKFSKSTGVSRVVYFACNTDSLGGRKSKYLRITPNRYYSWNDLLNDLTVKLKRDGCYLPHGVRQIYTPLHGHRIASLSDLQDGELYLCAGIEPFKPNQFKTPEAIQQFKEQAQAPNVHQAAHVTTKSLVLPVVNTINLAASDSSLYFGGQPSRYQRTPGFPPGASANVRVLNASVPVTLRGKFDNRFGRINKRYQRLPAIKEQRELEKDGNDTDTEHHNRLAMDSNVAKFLREELLNQAASSEKSDHSVGGNAAANQARKRDTVSSNAQNQQQLATEQLTTVQLSQTGGEVKRTLHPVPFAEQAGAQSNRLITIIYYERASSNCKIIKIMLNPPNLPTLNASNDLNSQPEPMDDAYSKYQRLYSLKRIRKILNKTFSKDAALKQKISKNSLLRLVTPSGREVTNTPDLLKILDSERDKEKPKDDSAPTTERHLRKTSVGAAISENNYLLIAVHDFPLDTDEVSGVASRLNRTPISDRLDTTTISNYDLELILQELIAKNANKRLIHKLYQALHNKQVPLPAEAAKPVVPKLDVTAEEKPQELQAGPKRADESNVQQPEKEKERRRDVLSESAAKPKVNKENQSPNVQSGANKQTVTSGISTVQTHPAESTTDLRATDAQKNKRVKFAEKTPPDTAVNVSSDEEGKQKQNQNRSKRRLSKPTQLPQIAQAQEESSAEGPEMKTAATPRHEQATGKHSKVAQDSAAPNRASQDTDRSNEQAGSIPDSESDKSEAERRQLEAERKRRNQLITLVRRTLPPAPAFPTTVTSQPAVGSSATPAAVLPPIATQKARDDSPEKADAAPSSRKDEASNDPSKPPKEMLDQTETAEKRTISAPKKSMLSLDTPRDTQIDIKALQMVQQEVGTDDDDAATSAQPNVDVPKEQNNAGEKQKAVDTDRQAEKPKLNLRFTPTVEVSKQAETKDAQLTTAPQPILKATPRETAPSAPKHPVEAMPAQPQPQPQQQPQPQLQSQAQPQPQPQVQPQTQQQPQPQNQPKDKEDKRAQKVNAVGNGAPPGKSRYSFTKFIRGLDVLQDHYEFGRQLGDGNFAIVRECRSKVSGKEYAIKIIDKAKLRNKEYMLENEIRVLKTCSHPNIIELKDQFESEPNVFLIMELARGGDLFDYITSHVKFNEAQAYEIVFDMAEAIFYLHSRNIVHRDLKPENLLICDAKDGRKITKLGDFGLSMEVKKPIFTVCGTPTYVAPEILMERGYGLEVDMWALGVITYILLCGFPPFRSPERRQSELFRMIKRGDFEFIAPYWDPVSASAKDLIRRLLVVEPSRRYKSIDVLTHPWVLTKGNVKRLDRHALAELQEKTRSDLEQRAAVLLKEYKDKLVQLDQQFNK